MGDPRWNAGRRNGRQMLCELQERGFRGNHATVLRHAFEENEKEETRMNTIFRNALVAIMMVLFASPGLAADKTAHRIVIQVSENDPGQMNLALTNSG